MPRDRVRAWSAAVRLRRCRRSAAAPTTGSPRRSRAACGRTRSRYTFDGPLLAPANPTSPADDVVIEPSPVDLELPEGEEPSVHSGVYRHDDRSAWAEPPVSPAIRSGQPDCVARPESARTGSSRRSPREGPRRASQAMRSPPAARASATIARAMDRVIARRLRSWYEPSGVAHPVPNRSPLAAAWAATLPRCSSASTIS